MWRSVDTEHRTYAPACTRAADRLLLLCAVLDSWRLGTTQPPPPPFIPITPERRGMSGKQLVLSIRWSTRQQTDGPRDTVKSFA